MGIFGFIISASANLITTGKLVGIEESIRNIILIQNGKMTLIITLIF